MRGVSSFAIVLWLAAAGPVQGTDPASFLIAGESALEAGEWAAAEISFRRALAADRRSARAQIGLARSLAGAGDPESAVAGLARVAEHWGETGDYSGAGRLLEVASELQPENASVLAALGRALVLDRKYLAAEAPLRRLYESGAADVEALLYYGATLWENGELADAEEVLRTAAAASGEAFPALYQLGRLLLWQSRYPEAAGYLERCVRLAPGSADVRLDLARAVDGSGDAARAIEHFRAAVALAPEHSELRYGLATALLRSGDRAAAEGELATYRALYEADQERTRDAGLAAARIARGRELLKLGREREAIEHLMSLPESVDSLAGLAAALRSSGDLATAAEALEKALALDSSRTDLRALLNETRLELLRQ